MLNIKVLPANCGDCILISFSKDKDNISNILIDGGIALTYIKLKRELIKIKDNKQFIDLLVITHSHADHINGIIKFIEDEEVNHLIKKIWFNSGIYFDKEKIEMLTQDCSLDISLKKIKYLEDKLIEMKFHKKNIWNNNLIKQGCISNINDARITVLTPNEYGLDKLKKFTRKDKNLNISGKEHDYSTKISEFNLNNFKEDKNIENETSISFMFEFSEKRILFLADSTPSAVIDGFNKTKILDNDNYINYIKLSHHASKGNLSNELLDRISCTNYIVSTNGLCANKLPNKEVFARIVKYFKSINIYFNYKINDLFLNDDFKTKDYDITIINLDEDKINPYEIEIIK
jgi:beta-lactamase superfamily II metal-dependent hydrolase